MEIAGIKIYYRCERSFNTSIRFVDFAVCFELVNYAVEQNHFAIEFIERADAEITVL
jgi:hypothetical protein